MRYFYPLLLILGIIVVSCQKSTQNKIDDDTFVQIYCDIVSVVDLVEVDKREALRDSILKNYNTNYEEFQQKLSAIKQNRQKWLEIYDKIVNELEKRVQAAEANIPKKKKK